MAGFYIHIPFCKKVCYYCDFHFVATLKYKDDMIIALQKEVTNRKNEGNEIIFDTLYFGGGTPSLLSVDEINKLSDLITNTYSFSNNIEFTIEVNPDDLSMKYLNELKHNTQINRLSIGTQSFDERDLKLMNRRHTSNEAINTIKDAMAIGFNNLNIDLIYGIPGQSDEKWAKNIDTFIELNIPHLSAYHLSFEPKTVFEHMRKKNKIKPTPEETSEKHYSSLINILRNNGYDHYEVSNFARQGMFSRHNSNYWGGRPYIGIGPSAHSFDGKSRRWNIANNTKYCASLANNNNQYYSTETPSKNSSFNEYILTSLRTSAGVNFNIVLNRFGKAYIDYINNTLKKFSESKDYLLTSNGFRITEESWLISDYIIREFFF